MKILLLDTNVSSYPIYKELAMDGNDVYVCGGNPSDFLAKVLHNKYIKLDYSDLNSLYQCAVSNRFDAVLPGCNDRSYLSCAMLKKRLHCIATDDLDATNVINNKSEFRAYALKNNLPVPRIFSQSEVASNSGCLIVKPVDAYSGRGISIVETAKELDDAIVKAKKFSPSESFIIEEFVTGQLYSHTAFLTGHQVVADFIVEEHGSANAFVVDTSYVVEDFNRVVLNEIRKHIEYMSKNLGLSDGLIHTQFISREDKFWFIEITRRCPGDLYSRLIELSTGYPYARIYATQFLGGEIIASKGGGFNKILRHTISTDYPLNFTMVSFMHSAPLKEYVSLAQSGSVIESSPFGRVGIAFFEFQDQAELKQCKSRMLQRKLYSLNF